jgi:putative Ca2+/H+ antiporter (TMEM165/GDT1 family)
MTNKKIPVLTIVLFIIALLLCAYSVWTLVFSHTYITEIIAQGGASLEDNFYEIFSYYVSGVANYVLFAILFVVIGLKHWWAAPAQSEEFYEDSEQYDEESDDEDVDFESIEFLTIPEEDIEASDEAQAADAEDANDNSDGDNTEGAEEEKA